MTRRLTWKKAQAHKIALEIAQDIADAFNVPAPVFAVPDYMTGTEWEWRCERVQVWTKAGAAELSVDISPRFAHLYFRFDDPARAVPFDDAMSRLNRFSGKWNHHATPDGYTRHGNPSPQDALEMFRLHLQNDFARVAEPNPPADEATAWQAKEDARRAAFNSYLASLSA